jgi:hypothetical protein
MKQLNTVIGGDFPEGSSIDLLKTSKGYAVEIRDRGSGSLHRFSLSADVSEIRPMRSENMDGSLSPLESGIIGGAVASYPGFLGAYLTAKEPDAFVFLCRLKDGRQFYGYCSRAFYEKMARAFSQGRDLSVGCCMSSLILIPFCFLKKIFFYFVF